MLVSRFLLLVAVGVTAPAVGQQPVRIEIGGAKPEGPPTLPVAPGGGGEFVLPRGHHPWTRHSLGSFRTLKVVSESFDAAGEITGRTQTEKTDRLVGVGGGAYTLQSTATIQLGGARVPGQQEAVTYQTLTDSAATLTSAVELEPAEFTVGGRIIPCRRWKLSTSVGSRTTTETVWYSAEHSPYVLRRDRTISETSGGEVTEVHERVTQLETPVLRDGELVEACVVEVQTLRSGGRIDRVEVRSGAAPGGVVSAWSTERDAEGRRTRWSVTQLTESDDGSGSKNRRGRWRLFGRRAD